MNVGTVGHLRPMALAAIVAAAGLASPPDCRAQRAQGERIRDRETFASGNVLSPGARDDWPIRARDGEAVILAVSSRAFDPAVALIGPDGRVVAENDDVRPGEQDALLLARLEEGGDYRVRVAASEDAKGAAGGRYELTVRRFVAAELAVGARATGTLGRTLAHWRRFHADAGQTLVITARAASFRPRIEVVAPSGEPVAADAALAVAQDATRAVIRADRAGTYYARIAPEQGGDPRASLAVTVAAARVFPTAIGNPAAERRIDPGGLDLWTFKGEAGDLVRVRARAAEGEMVGRIAYVPPADEDGRPRAPEGPVPPLVVLPSDPKSGGELVALLNLPGTYQVAVSQPLGVGVGYSFATTRPARALEAGADADPAGTLGLGGSDYWAIEGAAGQIIRVDAASERFDAEVELFGPQGDRIGGDDDGGQGRGARLTALLTERGRHLLRVHAHGDGGAGPYTLRRVPDPARPLMIGGRVEGTVGAGGGEVWSFAGRAGQTVILSARSPDFNIRASLFGPDAAEVASDDDGGEGTDSLLSARLPVDGIYTIWINSAAGGGGYSLQLIEAK